jgi:hypothetical protein
MRIYSDVIAEKVQIQASRKTERRA